MTTSIQVDDSHRHDVTALIETHLRFARSETPLCHVFALSPDELTSDDVVLYSCRRDDLLLGIGALRKIDAHHFEVKSMHTAEFARGQGVAHQLLNYLIDIARHQGASRVSLETGTSPGFEAARTLYRGAGFIECPPFGDYTLSPDNVCMTRAL